LFVLASTPAVDGVGPNAVGGGIMLNVGRKWQVCLYEKYYYSVFLLCALNKFNTRVINNKTGNVHMV
jgi:hypothetical protein